MRRWKPIAGYEDLYRISDDGLVLSLKYRGTNRAALLKTPPHQQGSKGYARCVLRDHAGRTRNWLVHRLVALAFLPPPTNPLQITVNHKDGDKLNNTVENLEWASKKEQSRHAADVLGRFHGECGGNAKLSATDVDAIVCRTDQTFTAIAKEFAVNTQTVADIFNGRTWRSVTRFKRTKGKPRKKLSPQQIVWAREEVISGRSQASIAVELGVSTATISRALNHYDVGGVRPSARPVPCE